MAYILDRPGTRFPNPCPVCGVTDEHAAWRETVTGSPCTYCPHPAEPGHGTGCCCAGCPDSAPVSLAKLAAEILRQEQGLADGTLVRGGGFIWPNPARQDALGPDEIRSLLRECVTVVKPGETLILRCPEGWTPNQVREIQRHAHRWLEENAPDVRVMVVPHLDMAVMEAEGGTDEPPVA
jgi:hypothetical protein